MKYTQQKHFYLLELSTMYYKVNHLYHCRLFLLPVLLIDDTIFVELSMFPIFRCSKIKMYDFSSLSEFEVEFDNGNAVVLFCALVFEDSNRPNPAINVAKMIDNNRFFTFIYMSYSQVK